MTRLSIISEATQSLDHLIGALHGTFGFIQQKFFLTKLLYLFTQINQKFMLFFGVCFEPNYNHSNRATISSELVNCPNFDKSSRRFRNSIKVIRNCQSGGTSAAGSSRSS